MKSGSVLTEELFMFQQRTAGGNDGAEVCFVARQETTKD